METININLFLNRDTKVFVEFSRLKKGAKFKYKKDMYKKLQHHDKYDNAQHINDGISIEVDGDHLVKTKLKNIKR